MSHVTCEICGNTLLFEEDDGDPHFCCWAHCLEYMMGANRITMDEQIVDDPPLADFCHP